jgi:hypothetical protein
MFAHTVQHIVSDLPSPEGGVGGGGSRRWFYVFALSHISIWLQAPLNAPPGGHSDIDSTSTILTL